MNILSELVAAAEAQGLTQEAWAERAGVAIRIPNRIKNGRTTAPRLDTLQHLGAVVGLRLVWGRME